MNFKRYILASIAAFVTFQVSSFIVHGLILMKTYEALASIWRPDMMSLMWVMYLTSFILSFFFVFIFSKGYEGKGITEGIRFGLIIGLFMNIAAFNQYAVYPIPLSLSVQWFICDVITFVIAGIVVSLIYKPKEA